MKAIICLFIEQSNVVVFNYGDFQWSAKHQCHVWQGRELEMTEFNRVVDGVLSEYDHFLPGGRTVRLLEDDQALVPVPALVPPLSIPVAARKPAARKPSNKVATIPIPALT